MTYSGDLFCSLPGMFSDFVGGRTGRGYTTTLNSSSLELNIKMHAFAYNIAYGFVSYSPMKNKH